MRGGTSWCGGRKATTCARPRRLRRRPRGPAGPPGTGWARRLAAHGRVETLGGAPPAASTPPRSDHRRPLCRAARAVGPPRRPALAGRRAARKSGPPPRERGTLALADHRTGGDRGGLLADRRGLLGALANRAAVALRQERARG